MNRIGKKEIAPDAARLFEEEVLGLKPDISRKALVNDTIIIKRTTWARKKPMR